MSTEGIDEWVGEVHTGDSLEVLDDLPAESAHAVVTDPPYGLAFMGRDWDTFDPKEYQQWCERWASKAKRVLKPGGHLLAFSGNRTHHRLFTGVEDAGFEVRDTITWHYGSGFPKAADVSKVIDKRADADREVVDEREAHDITGGNYGSEDSHGKTQTIEYTKPATDAAKRWEGWKTGLKPATEFVVMARKPFDGATVDCVLEHGTGALNIDGCRIDSGERPHRTETNDKERPAAFGGDGGSKATGITREGRYPANVAFGERAAEALDAEVGELSSGSRKAGTYDGVGDVTYGEFDDAELPDLEGSTGGPSRYFYTSKATRAERTEGGWIENDHPTVKPTDFMDWLVRLVTRRDQVVLDPFAGSGTTCKAAKEAHRQFIGIEKDPEWADVARARIGIDVVDPSHVVDTDEHVPISEF